MSINFSEVKSIAIPEGDVKSISINGVVVWQAPPKVLTSIALSGQTTSFNVGDTFVFGGTVIASYSNGTTANVTSGTTFSGYNMSSAGTQTVIASYTENGVTVTATYNITVTYSTYSLTYQYSGAGNIKGRLRVRYHDASGSWVWGSTTKATEGASNNIKVTAAKNTTIQVQIYNDSNFTNSYDIKQVKNGSITTLKSNQGVGSNSNATWTSGNLTPGNNNTLIIQAVA